MEVGLLTLSEQPLVSVLLCNYNYGRYVGEAIDSVLRQTYGNFELVVVDDGSTDDSRYVITSYADARIRKVFHNQNRGQATAFNTGFAETNGILIAFLDSDDAWKPEKLASVVDAFGPGDFCLVQHNLEVIDSHSRPVGRTHPGLRPGVRDVLRAYFAQNRTGFFSASSGITCRRSALEKIFPLPESWRICADVPLTRPLPIFGPVYTLKESLGYYRIHGSNFWMNTEHQQLWMENEQRYADYANEWLAKCGYGERIDFSKSDIYQSWRLQQLPRCHPRRLLEDARVTVATVLPEPLKVRYRLLRRRLGHRARFP